MLQKRIIWIELLLVSCIMSGCGADHTEPEPEENDTGQPTDFDVMPGGVVTEISAAVHAKVKTILVIRWTQAVDTRSTHIAYSFENDEWRETPAQSRDAGVHQAALIGIPEKTAVRFYIVTEVDAAMMDAGELAVDAGDGGIVKSDVFSATTGELPSRMPRPSVLSYQPALASEAFWLLGSVEDTPSKNAYYVGPFWIFIMDRLGRIVWYYADLADNPCMAYPRVARDGSHLYVEKRMFYSSNGYRPRVVRMTLDHSQVEEIPISDLDDCIDVTDDGGILYNEWNRKDSARLMERRPNGDLRQIWNCHAWAANAGVLTRENYCYSNTVSWNPTDDTVLMSMPYINTAVEIDRQTGRLISQWGDVQGSFAFDPPSWELEFNHFANITPEGTLLISTHAPGHEDTKKVGEHRFVEFEIDRDNRRLVERWVYGEKIDEWPQFKGEAQRLEGGNTLVNYGTGGVIHEVTSDKKTAWHVKWDADFNDDHFNKMVGHTIFIDDLYALCRGWE
jgi:hypothetical protein